MRPQRYALFSIQPNNKTKKKAKTPKEPKPRVPKRPAKGPAKNEIKPGAVDDMVVEAMIHNMLQDGKPSPFLLDFIKMVRRERGNGSQVTGEGTNYASQPWKIEDDLRLRELFLEGTTIAQLTQEFNRTYGSIKARLKKLGLTE